ncbi:hypothetical protein [Pseudomonas sp. MAG002Y]|uniref:hypothetical protein n=1 Tax=Pseudomonas sp. MAG002Y TaxID=2678690 RepID=UPI001C6098B0|nr:hypothetical protein [Pseudomonas sp. MAG002Y]MBW5416244.1 hypothetical protein [Pseudomonas sp. MAG002Y]
MSNQIRQRYADLADSIFQQIEPTLQKLSNQVIELGGIDEEVLSIVDGWQNRKALWNWRAVLKAEKKKPKRIEVSFHVNGTLCGLMLARFSKRRISINVRFIEASPDPSHPLRQKFLPASLLFAELFAAAIGATYVHVSKPVEALVPKYRKLGYDLDSADKARERKGFKPRCLLLTKRLPSL